MYFVHQESFHLKRKMLQQIVTKIYYIDRSYLGKSIRKNSLPCSNWTWNHCLQCSGEISVSCNDRTIYGTTFVTESKHACKLHHKWPWPHSFFSGNCECFWERTVRCRSLEFFNLIKFPQRGGKAVWICWRAFLGWVYALCISSTFLQSQLSNKKWETRIEPSLRSRAVASRSELLEL